MPHDPTLLADDIDKLRTERGLYLRMLELGTTAEIEPLLEEALRLMAEVSGARRGYIEVSGDAAEPRFWIALGCYDADVSEIRAAFSRGVIAEAIATGQTIVTESALNDPRFQDRGSVQRNRTEAVLCAPIGADPPLGVLYLQDRKEAGPFSEVDRRRAEMLARYLSVFVDRLLIRRERHEQHDATRGHRATLDVEDVIGASPALAEVLQQVALIVHLDIAVLITGASGTGKSQLARVIHRSGPRKSGPFVELNCAALPEALLESELFGAVPGAHSTATSRMPGKVQAAEGGTLFLDEIGELPPASQAKLLQLLQSKEYYPLGASAPVRANVRILAATNQDLRSAMEEKRFRQDLYYRLEILPIRVPSLAERREDIRVLAEHHRARAVERHGLPRLRLSPGALAAAECADWPGNVRELEHRIEAAVIRAAGTGAREVGVAHLFPGTAADGTRATTFHEQTRRFQAELVRRALEETGWNVTDAAHRLDLARSHLYKLIGAFGLARSQDG